VSHAPGRGVATLSLIGAAFGFSTIAIFTTLLTNAGTPLLAAMAGRYIVASLVLLPMAGAAAMRLPRARIAQLAIVGGLGQAVIAFLSLSALAFIPAATLVFLFYTFPAWVAVRAAVLRSEPLTRVRLFCLALSFTGVVAMVGWEGTGAVHPLGAGLALSAAIVYALFIPLIDRLRTGVTALVATTWVAVGAPSSSLSPALWPGSSFFQPSRCHGRGSSGWERSAPRWRSACSSTASRPLGQ